MTLGKFKRMLEFCGYPQYGQGGAAGLGLKAEGVFLQSITAASVTGTTSNTTVVTDTIPAGTLKVGDIIDFFGTCNKTGTGTVTLRVFISDGTNGIQIVGAASSTGVACMGAGNFLPLIAHASQYGANPSSPYSTGAVLTGALDETKAWSVQWQLQQSVSTDTSTLRLRRIKVSRQ